MLKILIVPTGMLEENCYIIYEDTHNIAFLIDPGDEGERLSEILEAKGIRPKMIINTHGHFDHIGAVSYLKEKYMEPNLYDIRLKGLVDSKSTLELKNALEKIGYSISSIDHTLPSLESVFFKINSDNPSGNGNKNESRL